MLGKKIYSLLAAAIVVAMCSVAAKATTMYCVCPGASSAPYYYDIGTQSTTQMTSCEIDGLDGLPCYSATMSSSTTGFILITTNSGNSDWSGTRASYSGSTDIYASNLTAINGDFYLFWAYESSTAYNLTSATSGTASGQYFMSEGNGWGSDGSSLTSTSYSNVYSADVTLSSSISEFLLCSTSYGNKVGTSSTVYVDTQYALSSSYTTYTSNVPASIDSGSYTAYYISDNVTGGGYLYITASESSSSDDDDSDTTTSAPDLYVRCNSSGSWAAQSGYKMDVTEADGTYTYTLTLTDWALQEFKIADANWSDTYNFGGVSSILSGTEYTLTQGASSTNISFSESGTASTITFTLTYGTSASTATLKVEYTLSESSSSDDSSSSTTSDYYTIYIHDTGTSGYYLYVWGTDSSESGTVVYAADGTYSVSNSWPGFDFTELSTTIVDDVEYYYLQISSSLTNIGLAFASGSSSSASNVFQIDKVTGDVYILIDGGSVSQTQPTASSLSSSNSDEATDVSNYGYFYITGDWNELNGKWLPNPYGLFSTNTDEETKDTYSLVATIYNFSGKFKVLGTESSSKQYHVESGCAWLTSTSGVLSLGTKYTLADNNTNPLISNNMLIGDETTSYSKLIFYFNPSDGAFMITEDTLTDDEESAYEYKYYLATSFNDYYNGRTSESSSTGGNDDDSTTSVNTVTIKVYLGDNSSSFLANGDGNAYIYSWYYTEAGVKVEELGAWPGTALDVTEDYATLTLERKASANFIISNGLGGGENGENQTHDIVLGNYSGEVTITIGSQETNPYFSSNGSTAYYYSHTVSAVPSSEISFYMVPDEASAPYLYVWDSSTYANGFSAWPGTKFSEIVEVSGHYLYKLTYTNSDSEPLGAIINDGTDDNDYDKTVNITSILADVYLDWLDDQNENQSDGIGKYWNDTYNTVALISVDQSTDDESLSKYTLDESTPYLFKMVAISDLMDSEQDAATYTDANGNEQKYDVQSEAWYTVIYDITGEDDASVKSTSATDLNNTADYTVDVIPSTNTFDESTDFYVIASNAHGDLVKYSTGGSVGYSQYLTYSTGNGNTTLTTPSTMYEKDTNGGNKYSYAFFVVETQNVSSSTSAAARSNVKTAKATTDGSYAVVGGGSTLNVMVYLASEAGVQTGINKVDSEGNVIVAERYFRLDGIEVAEPSTDNRQIYVILRTYDDGSVKAFKEVR